MKKEQITRHMYWMKNDLIICIQNENGHIGSVVIGQPYFKNDAIHVTTQVWNQLTHKDELVAKMYVEAACKKLNTTVCCICGIHIDQITPQEIDEIMRYIKEDIQAMILEL